MNDSLRLLRTSLRNKRSILSALWFEESLVVNTKELSRLILLILIVHEYQHPVMLMNSLYLDGNQKDHEYEEFSEIKHFAHETVCA